MPGRVAETAKMVAELDLKTGKFTKGVSTAVGSLGKLTGSVAKSRAVAVALGTGLERAGEAGLRAFAGAIGDGLQSMADLETAATANEAAIKQVGLAGQVTADQIAAWSVQIETAVGSAFDDKQINAAAGTLIRYGKVTAQNLEPALVVMTDLAAKTGDVESAATLLAKALADPEKAAGKLARQGIILTKAQQDQIKAFVKAGKTAQAQQVILDALAKTTAGAAKASQGPYQQSINQLRDAYEEATKALAVGFLPLITKVRDILTTELAKPETLNNIKAFGTSLASGLSGLIDVARSLPWTAIGNALKIAGTGAKAVLDAFLAMPAWVQTAIVTGWGLNKLTGGALSGALTGLVGNIAKSFLQSIGLMKINAAVVQVSGPVAGVPGAGAGGGVPGFSPTAQGSGGLSGLLKGIPIIGAALAGAEFANIAAPIMAEKLKEVTPQASGDIAAGAAKAVVGALTGPLGFPNLIGGIQDIAGNIASLIPLIDAKNHPAPDIGGKIETLIDRFPGEIGAAISDAGAQRDAETSSSIQALIASTVPIAQSSDIQALQSVTGDGLSAVGIDTINAGSTMSDAARQAGLTAGNAALSAGYTVASAIASNRPITNVTVNVVATTVQKTVDVVTRYGPPGGDRDSSDRNRYG